MIEARLYFKSEIAVISASAKKNTLNRLAIALPNDHRLMTKVNLHEGAIACNNVLATSRVD